MEYQLTFPYSNSESILPSSKRLISKSRLIRLWRLFKLALLCTITRRLTLWALEIS